MRIEIIIGSPRKKGNTFLLADALINKIQSKYTSANITYLYDYAINPCIDCRNCKKGNSTCTVNDDTQSMYSKLEYADTIIFGTPIYWFGATAKMKLLVDRLRPYFVNRKLVGKKAALLIAAAEGEEDSFLTIEMFKKIFKTLGILYVGVAVTKAYDIGDADYDANVARSLEQLALRLMQ